jgi:hypothetical protein
MAGDLFDGRFGGPFDGRLDDGFGESGLDGGKRRLGGRRFRGGS